MSPRPSGPNIYDQEYRDALALYESGPMGEAVEELQQRTQLGKLQKSSFQAMRGGGPLAVAQGLGGVVPYQQAAVQRFGGERAAREKGRTGFTMGQYKRGGEIDQFKAAQATRRAMALADYNAKAIAAKEDADAARKAQFFTMGASVAGGVQKWIDQAPMDSKLPAPGTTGYDPATGEQWWEL